MQLGSDAAVYLRFICGLSAVYLQFIVCSLHDLTAQQFLPAKMHCYLRAYAVNTGMAMPYAASHSGSSRMLRICMQNPCVGMQTQCSVGSSHSTGDRLKVHSAGPYLQAGLRQRGGLKHGFGKDCLYFLLQPLLLISCCCAFVHLSPLSAQC